MKVLLLFGFLLATCAAFETCGKKGDGASKIVGGLDAGHGEFPWQISLQTYSRWYGKWNHICGGTLIAPNWVLCAAHCFESASNPINYRIVAGEWRLHEDDTTEQTFDVEKIVRHQQFSRPQRFQHDISLIKIKGKVDFTGAYAGPACLPTPNDDYHGAKNCWLSGWGRTQAQPATRPTVLQKLSGYIWTDADLKAEWGSKIQPGMMGFGTHSTSACMGDSGGPLVCPSKSKPGQYDVAGVVSWGIGTCSGRAGIFTEVKHFLPWINEVVNSN